MFTAVVTAIPDRLDMLSEALRSVVAQTHLPAETLVYLNNDMRVGVEHGNRIVCAASEPWLAWLHDDDIWLPNHLAELAKVIEATNCDVVQSSYRVIGGESFGHICDPAMFVHRNWVMPSAVAMKADLFRVLGGWKDETETGMWPDWHLWQAAYQFGAKWACCHKITVKYRIHGTNMHLNEKVPA